jgi:serine/threonine protein phosphatase PrpC
MDFVSTGTHIVLTTECVEQLSKGQDFTCSGQTIFAETGEEIHYACVMDGHGSDSCINFIRALPKTKIDELMGLTCPIRALQALIDKENAVRPRESSGATMCLARRFSDHIECLNCGDSQLVVFKNDKIEFISEEHNSNNEKERTRLSRTFDFLRFEESANIKMVAENKMTKADGHYAAFSNSTRLATTQALGHNGITGIRPDQKIIQYGSSDEIRVLIGSDGLFDMIIKKEDGSYLEHDIMAMHSMPCELIVKRAVDRWLQEWHGDFNGITQTYHYTKQDCDDVCAIVMDIIPMQAVNPGAACAIATPPS